MYPNFQLIRVTTLRTRWVLLFGKKGKILTSNHYALPRVNALPNNDSFTNKHTKYKINKC